MFYIDESPVNSILYQLAYGDMVLIDGKTIVGVEINSDLQLALHYQLSNQDTNFDVVIGGSTTVSLVPGAGSAIPRNLSSINFIGAQNAVLRIAGVPQLLNISLGGTLTLDTLGMNLVTQLYTRVLRNSDITLIVPVNSRNFILTFPEGDAKVRVRNLIIEAVMPERNSFNVRTSLNRINASIFSGTYLVIFENILTRANYGTIKIFCVNEVKLIDIELQFLIRGWKGFVLHTLRSEIRTKENFTGTIIPAE